MRAAVMGGQAADRRKHLLALATLVRVGQLPIAATQMDLLFVRHHVAIAAKRFAAYVTVVVLDAGVRDHVPRQIAGRDEGLRADGALVVADASVDFFVGLKGIIHKKS